MADEDSKKKKKEVKPPDPIFVNPQSVPVVHQPVLKDPNVEPLGLEPAPYQPESELRKIAVQMLSDPGLSPMGLGFVVGSPGGEELASKLMATKGIRTAHDAVMKYMALKYPKLMSAITGGFTETFEPTSRVASYLPEEKAIEMNVLQYGDPMKTAESIGHELTHGGIQAVRTPEMIGKNYIKPPRSIGTPRGLARYDAYYNQPAEVNARRGGATAAKTLRKYIEVYPELKKLFGE
jgi:hypothetical protein